MDPDEKFAQKLQRDPSGCLIWTGERGPDGYGRFVVHGRGHAAHRWAFEMAYGPIPEGLTVDHDCHNWAVSAGTCAGGPSCPHRACCEPSHLELRTGWDNTRRGMAPAAVNARKTHCDYGHELPES